MMMMTTMMTMMTHLYSPPILLNHWWWRLPLVSRHSEKRQMCLTNVFDESRSSAKIANYCPLLPTRQRRGVRVAGFPQNIDHAGDSKTHPIEGMSFHVYRTLTITPLPTWYWCLECLHQHVCNDVVIVPNFQYPLFQVSVLGIEILTEDGIAHRKAFGVIRCDFSQMIFDQPRCNSDELSLLQMFWIDRLKWWNSSRRLNQMGILIPLRLFYSKCPTVFHKMVWPLIS